MSDIEKKYYSTAEIAKECKVYAANIQHWLDHGMLEEIQPVDTRNGRRIYSLYQRYFIRRMAKLMATGFYTVKGALASIESDVEMPTINKQSDFKVGDKVHYQPKHYEHGRWENGIVKEIPSHTTASIRVVYNCGGDWDRFEDYTSALTHLGDLKLGWMP